MQVLIDTNVLLDVLLNRDPWATESSAVWRAHDEGNIVGHVTACALTDIFFIARRLAGLEKARTAIHLCLGAFEICDVGRLALSRAQESPGDDFEDNLQIAVAELADLDAIVTRDEKGFQGAAIAVLTPAEVLIRLDQHKD